ncbi:MULTISPECIES: glycine betaine ABC transporter substrate-binding protein [Kocuria]
MPPRPQPCWIDCAAAENKDAMVVTSGTAEQYGLTSIADLAEVCGELVIAGPPEFAERAYGLDGLEEKYGCVPESFEPINDGGCQCPKSTARIPEVLCTR